MACPPIPYPFPPGLTKEQQRQLLRNFQHLVECLCCTGDESID